MKVKRNGHRVKVRVGTVPTKPPSRVAKVWRRLIETVNRWSETY